MSTETFGVDLAPPRLRDPDPVGGGPGTHVPVIEGLFRQARRFLAPALDADGRVVGTLGGRRTIVTPDALVARFRDSDLARQRGHGWSLTPELAAEVVERLRARCEAEGRQEAPAPAPAPDPFEALDGRRLSPRERARLIELATAEPRPEPLVFEQVSQPVPPPLPETGLDRLRRRLGGR